MVWTESMVKVKAAAREVKLQFCSRGWCLRHWQFACEDWRPAETSLWIRRSAVTCTTLAFKMR